MKTLIIQNDKEAMDDTLHVFQFCLPEAELVCTNLGGKGIEMVKRTPLDMVIIDVNLPDMSGFDVLKQIRGHSQFPVIIQSFLKDEIDKVQSMDLGADTYIVKTLLPNGVYCPY